MDAKIKQILAAYNSLAKIDRDEAERWLVREEILLSVKEVEFLERKLAQREMYEQELVEI